MSPRPPALSLVQTAPIPRDGGAGVHADARRGRGSGSNATSRFDKLQTVALDDGWGALDLPPRVIRTSVRTDATRSIITRNSSPDVPFDRSVNPYRGCEHGCSYCFARPSHAYLGMSPGLDFESRLLAKPDAAKLLERELRAPGYRPLPMALGTNTDPYQPVERNWRITRQVLEVLRAFNHPVGIVTKGALITRDIDILADMAARHQAKVFMSITTLDRDLARRMEPRAATPERRLQAIRALADAGVPVGVMVAPVIPALNDHELENILEAAADAGAREAGWIMLRLPLEIKELFKEWLAEHVPARAERVMSHVKDMRGGKDYDAQWHVRMKGHGPYADLIDRRFSVATERLGLNRRRWLLDVRGFKPPPQLGEQLSLL